MLPRARIGLATLKQKVMRYLSVIGVCLAVAGSYPTFAQAEQAGWVGDVPVPATAIIDTTAAVSFDSPAGRVVKFTIQTRLNATDITSFYDETLAALGWEKQGGGYVKANETLRIKSDGTASDGQSLYVITVGPIS